MGPVLPEAEANPRPVVDYKAAAARGGDRVPRMVAALESKLNPVEQRSEVVNGVKKEGDQGDLEKKVVHSNGKVLKENGSSDHPKMDNPPSEKAAVAEEGWESAEPPGAHKQENVVKARVAEISKKESDENPPILPLPPRAAQQPPSVEAPPILKTPAIPSAATKAEDKEAVNESGRESGSPPVEVAAAASTEQIPQEEKPTRTFCLVRIPRPDGSIGGAAIREAENRLKDKREKQEFLTVALRLKQISRNEANGKVKEALEKLKAIREQVNARMGLVKPLWESQRRLQEAGKLANSKRRDLPCATEEELDYKIQQLEYSRQHESQSLTEEKRILREIRQLESSREQVKANSALLSQYTSSGAERESISTQLKPLQAELDALRAEESEAKKALDLVDGDQKELNRGVEELLAQREEAREEHQAAYEELKKLRQQAAQRDHDYFQNRRDIQRFKQLAAQRDIQALEEFANTQVEAIMARFSEDAAYRATYVKNNEISTLRRFGSLDTRSPGVDEDPAPLSPTPERAPAKASLKERDEPPAPAKSALAPAKGGETAGAKAGKPKAEAKPKAPEAKPKAEAKSKVAAPPEDVTGSKAVPAEDKVRATPVDKVAAAAAEAEAKERRREEEVRKAKEAEERKRRAAEKKAAKAEQRRKKEAEEAAKKKDKKKQTATPPSEAVDADSAAAATSEQESVAPAASAPDAAPAADEGPRRRGKPAVEKKLLKKALGRNKKFSLQSWLEANLTPVLIVALILVVLMAAYIWVKNTGNTLRG